MLAVVLLANSGPGIAHAMEQVPVLGAITRVFTFRTYEEDRGNTSAHIDIPSVEGGGDALSAAIQAYTDTIIQQYQYEAALQGELGHYDLDLTYTVATDNETVFALRFDQTLVMPAGMSRSKTTPWTRLQGSSSPCPISSARTATASPSSPKRSSARWRNRWPPMTKSTTGSMTRTWGT